MYGSLDDVDTVDPSHGDSKTTPSDEEYEVPADTPNIDGVAEPDNFLNAQILMDDTEVGRP